MTKKIVALLTVLTIICTAAITSAFAYTRKEAYGQDYQYTGTNSNVKWTFSGTSSTASTNASNSSGTVSKYMYVYVGRHYAEGNVCLNYQESDIETPNAGAGVGIQRDRTNDKVYYKHVVIIKTDSENQLNIAEHDYRVYQTKN